MSEAPTTTATPNPQAYENDCRPVAAGPVDEYWLNKLGPEGRKRYEEGLKRRKGMTSGQAA